MTSTTTGGPDDLRAAAADLDLIRKARDAVTAADDHLTDVMALVKARGQVTAEQIAVAARMTRRGAHARLARRSTSPTPTEET